MRKSIAITDKQLAELQKFANACPELQSQVARAVLFRQKVLEIFDRLAGTNSEAEPEKGINPPASEEKPFTREELYSSLNAAKMGLLVAQVPF